MDNLVLGVPGFVDWTVFPSPHRFHGRGDSRPGTLESEKAKAAPWRSEDTQ